MNPLVARDVSSRPAEGTWDRLLRATTELAAKPSFRLSAAKFPLTRPIARKRARQLFDLCAGFVYSQVLLACVRLRVFDIVGHSPLSLEELSQRLGLSTDATARLADAAVVLRLLRRDRRARYALGTLGAALIDNEAVCAMIEHNALLYADLSDPVALLRAGGAQGELARYWPYAQLTGSDERDAASAYSALMARSQPLVAQEILNAYPLHKHRCLLDVGGGNGEFLSAVAAKAPHLTLHLFDLPPVATLARKRLAPLLAQHRLEIFSGSFLDDALPRGADLISLVRVLHDHNDAGVTRVLSAVREALPPRGRVLVAEPMAETPGAETVGTYFDFYLFAMGKGRSRTEARLKELLRQCGFRRPRRVVTHVPLQTCLLVAER